MFRGASTLFNPTSSSAHRRQQARRNHRPDCLSFNSLFSTTVPLDAPSAHTAPTTSHCYTSARVVKRGLTSSLRIGRFTQVLLKGRHLSTITTLRVHASTPAATTTTRPATSRLPHHDPCASPDTGREHEVHTRAAREPQAITARQKARWAAVDPAMDGGAHRPKQ